MEKSHFCSSDCSQSQRLRLSNAACSAVERPLRRMHRRSHTKPPPQTKRQHDSGGKQAHSAAGPRETIGEETMMKAFSVDRYGSTDGVRAGEMPDPQLRE